MEQHLSVRNATRAAMAWSGSPVGLLTRVEVLVTVSCALLTALVFLGSGRRTSRSAAFRFVVWLALMMSYPAVSYTIGLMQSGSFHNDLVAVWACFLLGCSDSIATCSVDGSDNQARAMLNQATQVLYVFLLLVSYIASLHLHLKILLLLLWLLNVAKLGMRLATLASAGRREGVLTADNRLISKYMGHEYVRSVHDFDPETMEGYKYVVTAGKKNPQDGGGEYKLDVADNDLVTVDRVWRCKGGLLSGGGRLKDLCLSFALFKLLRRRLNRSPLHESDDVRTLVFVRRGLAGGDLCDDPERMFRVIEVELGFLYDFHYARYPSPKQTLIPETATFLAAVALSLCTLFSSPLLHYHHRYPGGIVTTGLDIWLARLVVVLFVILELFQYLSLVLSDWHKVKVLCRYVRRPSWHGHRVLEMLLWLMCRATLTTGYWSNSVGQYSLLHACLEDERSCLLRCVPPLHKWRWVKARVVEARRVTRRSLPATVKRAIHGLLRSDWLTYIMYGDRTLQRNNLLHDFDWSTSRYRYGYVGSILIWHIATTICDAADVGTTTAAAAGREVATTLSNYCAYLLFQAPELVTDAIYDERLLMDSLHRRIQRYLKLNNGCRSKDDMFHRLSTFKPSRVDAFYEEAILADGIRLGSLIPAKIPDEALRWDVLAEMWVELLLTVTPSDNVSDHIKKLATGGELITHLWALLMHGGIIDKPTKPSYGPGT